jgi:hypothetical protein
MHKPHIITQIIFCHLPDWHFSLYIAQNQQAQVPEPMPMQHQMTEYYEPVPKVVTPSAVPSNGWFLPHPMPWFCSMEKTSPSGKAKTGSQMDGI